MGFKNLLPHFNFGKALVFVALRLLSSCSETSLDATFHVCRSMVEAVALLLWHRDEGYFVWDFMPLNEFAGLLQTWKV